MAINRFIYLLPFMLLFTLSASSDPAGSSPAPAPQLGSDDSPPTPPLPTPAASPSTGSPPSPPPASDPSPSPATSPSADRSPTPSSSPAPETADAGDLSSTNVKNEESSKSSSGGMSGGKKAGIAIGVIAAACVVGFGGLLYKKRQQNIRRAEFSSAVRREFL